MICNKCGTIYPDNGTCPNCSGSDSFFKTAGSLDDSMDMSSPVSYPTPEPTPYTEPVHTSAAPNDDYMKTMRYSDVEMNIEPYVEESNEPSIDNPTWSASATAEAYSAPHSASYEVPSYTSAPPSTPVYSAPVKTSKPSYIAHIIISALIMAIMLFVPVISNGGMIPDSNALNLIDVVELMGESIPEETIVMLSLILLATIMSVTGFIGSCTKVKPLCIVSSIIGYVSLVMVAVIMMFKALAFSEDFEFVCRVLFDPDYASFTIFFWVAITLFLVHFIVSCATRSRK